MRQATGTTRGDILPAQHEPQHEPQRHTGRRLVQLYTGLVYRGPALLDEILEALARDKGAGPIQ